MTILAPLHVYFHHPPPCVCIAKQLGRDHAYFTRLRLINSALEQLDRVAAVCCIIIYYYYNGRSFESRWGRH